MTLALVLVGVILLGEPYRAYRARAKRLIPFVW